MTPTAWADLPNAKHIDRILADLEKNPDKWNAAWNAARTAAWSAERYAAWDAARDAARNAVNNAAWTAAWDAAWDAARNAARDDAWYDARADARADARDAILALIAYDDCAYLLDEKPEHVQMLALLGNERALLLYQACVALQKEMA